MLLSLLHFASVGAALAQTCNRANAVTVAKAFGGTNYDLGYSIGLSSASSISMKMATWQFANVSNFAWTSPAGVNLVSQLQASASALFPAFVDELNGIADGAASIYPSINRSSIWIFNMMDELEAIMPSSMGAPSSAPRPFGEESCTDVHLNEAPGVKSRWLAHNEDARRFNLGLMFLVDAVLGSPAHTHNYSAAAHSASTPTATNLAFTAFMYPGQLATGAFGYNQYGVFFSTNAVFPITCPGTQPPRAFIQRYLLEATSIADALARLKQAAPSCGFSANIGRVLPAGSASPPTPELWLYNVETSSTVGLLGITHVNGGSGNGNVTTYYHANMYRTLDNTTVPQVPDESSIQRLARLESLPVPTVDSSPSSLFTLLGDTSTPVYPIWREGQAPDCCATIVTATFEVQPPASSGEGERGVFSVYANNPKTCGAGLGPVLQRTFPA